MLYLYMDVFELKAFNKNDNIHKNRDYFKFLKILKLRGEAIYLLLYLF